MTENTYVVQDCCAERREAASQIVDIKFSALKEVYEKKIDAAIKAATLALSSQDFVKRSEFKEQVAFVESLRLSRAELAGKADQASVAWALIISVSGTTIGVVGIIIAILALIK